MELSKCMQKEESLQVALDQGLDCVFLRVPHSILRVESKESLPLIKKSLTASLVSHKIVDKGVILLPESWIISPFSLRNLENRIFAMRLSNFASLRYELS